MSLAARHHNAFDASYDEVATALFQSITKHQAFLISYVTWHLCTTKEVKEMHVGILDRRKAVLLTTKPEDEGVSYHYVIDNHGKLLRKNSLKPLTQDREVGLDDWRSGRISPVTISALETALVIVLATPCAMLAPSELEKWL